MAIGAEGVMLAVIAVSVFAYSLVVWEQPIDQARTVTFTVMVVTQLVHAFNCRSDRWSLFRLGLATNHSLVLAFLVSLGAQLAILTIPAAAPIFKIAPVPLEAWELMVSMGLLTLVVMEAVKWLKRHVK